MSCTSVFYESPFRIVSTIEMVRNIDPARELFVARELTKKFEEHLFGTADAVVKKLRKKERVKGELVVVMRGGSGSETVWADEEPDERRDEVDQDSAEED